MNTENFEDIDYLVLGVDELILTFDGENFIGKVLTKCGHRNILKADTVFNLVWVIREWIHEL